MSQQPVDPSICTAEDFRDIETAASDAGVSMRQVANHIADGLHITPYEKLPKNKKQQVLDWIEKQKK
jgi:hypothetical protein